MASKKISILAILVLALLSLGCIGSPEQQPNQTITQQNQTMQQNQTIQQNPGKAINVINISGKGDFSAPMLTVTMPDVSEGFVVWHQFFNGKPHIMAYDIASNKTAQLTNDSNQLSPHASGLLMVWLDQNNLKDQYGMSIYFYDSRNKSGYFLTSRKSGKTEPKIDDGHIVWAEMVNESKQLFLYDLASKTETQVTQGSFIPSTYYINGNFVVWGASRCNMSNYKCDMGYGTYDISSKTSDFVELEGMDKYCYDFKDNNIVYSRWEKPVYSGSEEIVAQIYLYNVKSKTGKMATSSKSNKNCPRISGNTIIWWDSRYNGSLYAYNIATNEEKNLLNLSSTGFYQYDISGKNIAYVDVYNSTGVNLLVLG